MAGHRRGRFLHGSRPVLDADDVVGEFDHALEPVLGHDHGDGQIVHETGDGCQHLLGSGRVQRAGGLVQHEHRGPRGECCPDGHPLLLPAGQAVETALAQRHQPQEVEGLLHAPAHHVGCEAQGLHRVGQLILHRVRGEARARVLAHGPHHSGEIPGSVGAGVQPVDAHPPGQRATGEMGDQAVDHVQQRGLARAGASDDQGEIALRDQQVDVAQHRLLAFRMRKVTCSKRIMPSSRAVAVAGVSSAGSAASTMAAVMQRR